MHLLMIVFDLDTVYILLCASWDTVGIELIVDKNDRREHVFTCPDQCQFIGLSSTVGLNGRNSSSKQMRHIGLQAQTNQIF